MAYSGRHLLPALTQLLVLRLHLPTVSSIKYTWCIRVLRAQGGDLRQQELILRLKLLKILTHAIHLSLHTLLHAAHLRLQLRHCLQRCRLPFHLIDERFANGYRYGSYGRISL